MAEHVNEPQAFGVSQDCAYNDHELCNTPRCGCDCHKRARAARDLDAVDRVRGARSPVSNVAAAPLEKHCPACGVCYPEDRNYCTVDGAKLSSLVCQDCGQVADPVDNFCGSCGFPIKKAQEEALAAAVELPEEAEAEVEPEPQAVGQPIIQASMYKI